MIKETTIEHDVYHALLNGKVGNDFAKKAGIEKKKIIGCITSLRRRGAEIANDRGDYILLKPIDGEIQKLIYAQIYNKLACDTPREWWSRTELEDIFDIDSVVVRNKIKYIEYNIAKVDRKRENGETYYRLLDLDGHKVDFTKDSKKKWFKNAMAHN